MSGLYRFDGNREVRVCDGCRATPREKGMRRFGTYRDPRDDWNYYICPDCRPFQVLASRKPKER